MKVTFREFEGCFSVELKAEDMAEAAALVRFGMNRTGEVRRCSTVVNQAGSFESNIVLAKSRRANNDVPKRP